MMGHHLPMVLSLRFGIKDENLVQVERELGNVVEFDGASKGHMRILNPHVDWIQELRRTVSMNPLEDADQISAHIVGEEEGENAKKTRTTP